MSAYNISRGPARIRVHQSRHNTSGLQAGPIRRFPATLGLIGAGLSGLLWSTTAGIARDWSLAIFGLGVFSAVAMSRSVLRRTPLDLSLALFLGTALIGVWAAYDRDAAQLKLWLLLGAIVLFYALATQRLPNLWPITALLAALGLIMALAFLLTHDWQAFPPKFALVHRLIVRWVAIRPSLGIDGFHPNVAGGLMALLIPFQLAIFWRAWMLRHTRQLLLIAASISLTLLALLLTSSRGAMLALAAGLVTWILWRQAVKRRTLLLRHSRTLLTVLVVSLASALLLLASGWSWRLAALVDHLPGPASAMGRARVASYTLDLISDFTFTGAGLASFPGLYSRYILGIPHFYLPNGHNILLDVALEQGLLGALAFLAIIAITFWLLLRHDLAQAPAGTTWDTRLIAGAALASFLALLLHSMVEDIVYGSAALPLLFTAPGLAIALDRGQGEFAASTSRWYRRSAAFFALAALVLVGFVALPQGRAHWWANLGAVSMARVELDTFPTGRWVTPQSPAALQKAESQFRTSLQLDARQRTAHHRLGLLEMERDDFAGAVAHLELAHARDPHHVGIRKALGYSYTWSGNLDRGSELLATVPFVSQELDAYVSWWQQHGRLDLAEIAAQMRVYLQ